MRMVGSAMVDALPACDATTEVQLYDGDGLEITPESKEFNFQCCKCGLVHKVEIEHTDDSVILRFFESE